jgi:hypothetical protein
LHPNNEENGRKAYVTSLPLNSKSTKLGLLLTQTILAGNLTSDSSPSLLNLIPALALLSHANQQLVTLREILERLGELDLGVAVGFGLDRSLSITVGGSLGLALLGGCLGLVVCCFGLGTTLLGRWSSGSGGCSRTFTGSGIATFGIDLGL